MAPVRPSGLLCLTLMLGCRPPAAGTGADWAALPGCDQAPGRLDARGLGVELAYTADDAPKDLEALARLVAAAGAAAPEWETSVSLPSDLAERAGLAIRRPVCRRASAARVRLEPPAGVRVVPLPPAVAETIGAAERHLAAGEDAEARTALQTAAAHEPLPLPGTLLGLGASYSRSERWAEAEAAFRRASREFPYAAAAWAGLGQAERQRERRLPSLAASARALALFPGDVATRRLLAGDPFVRVVAPAAPPAVPGGPAGRWRLGAAAADPFTRAEAEAYAGCRDGFRQSPELRRRLAGRDVADGLWSPAEESACTALWLRAYLRHRGQGRAADEALDDLVEVARAGLLDERALHDVGGLADPRILWLLDDARRERLFTFVERHRVIPREDMGLFGPF